MNTSCSSVVSSIRKTHSRFSVFAGLHMPERFSVPARQTAYPADLLY
jgi:hypothetical protein